MQTLTLFLKATLSVSWKKPRPSRLNRNGSWLFPGDPSCLKIVSKLSKVVSKLSLSFLKVVPELGQSCPNVVSQLSQSYSKVVSKLSLGSASGWFWLFPGSRQLQLLPKWKYHWNISPQISPMRGSQPLLVFVNPKSGGRQVRSPTKASYLIQRDRLCFWQKISIFFRKYNIIFVPPG